MDAIEHPAGACREYPCGSLTGHVRITSTPDHLAHTMTALVKAGRLMVSGGIAGAVYRVSCGEHSVTVRAIHVERSEASRSLMAARPEPAVEWIEVPDDGGVFLEVFR